MSEISQSVQMAPEAQQASPSINEAIFSDGLSTVMWSNFL